MPKKNRLPFDKRGSRIVLRVQMLNSIAYSNLSVQAKVLILLLQSHWRNDRAVGYGIREAMKKIPCSKLIAMRAFNELEENGFIELIDESLFIDRTNCKSRTWRLTWMPYQHREPTNEWEEIY